MWTKAATLYCVELAIYIPLASLALFFFFRHRQHGLLGYFYLNLFIPLRIISDIINIAQRNNKTPTVAAGVVSSIGLSPLLLALAGFLHEIHVYRVSVTHTAATARQVKRFLWILQILFHVGSGVGIALLIDGTINLIDDEQPSGDHSDIKSDNHYREAGGCLLALVWLTLAFYAIYVWAQVKRTKELKPLRLPTYATCVLLAVPFVGVRALYTVAYTFDHNSKSLNPITGSFAVKLVLVVLVQLLAVLALLVGSWLTKDIRAEARRQYEPVVPGLGQGYQLQHKDGPGNYSIPQSQQVSSGM